MFIIVNSYVDSSGVKNVAITDTRLIAREFIALFEENVTIWELEFPSRLATQVPLKDMYEDIE